MKRFNYKQWALTRAVGIASFGVVLVAVIAAKTKDELTRDLIYAALISAVISVVLTTIIVKACDAYVARRERRKSGKDE